MKADEITATLNAMPLERALWWFIENATPEVPWRTEVFVQLRSHMGAEPEPVAPAPSPWDEDPDFPVQDWQYEVANDDTRSGYLDWVTSQHEAQADEAAEP
jgi:hypothetical protein